MHPQIVESQCAETEVIQKNKSRSANIVQYAIPRFRFTPMWPLSPKYSSQLVQQIENPQPDQP